MNCTTEDRFVLVAEGINDTSTTTSFSDSANLGCSFSSGKSCSSSSSFTFSQPAGIRYEKLNDLGMRIFYNFSCNGLTIGEGSVSIDDDNGTSKIVWQNYSFASGSGTIIANYTLDGDEQSSFVDSARNIDLSSYVDATSSSSGNVTVQNISYTWDHGKLFNGTQNLFVDIHPFLFDLPTPVLQTPLNGSTQAATPVGLSWEAISAPEGVTISYYVFGDDTDASTQLDFITENLYLWRDLGAQQGTFYWKIVATDGTSNASSETWQFTLDLCQPNSVYAYALTYPMNYDTGSDTITVWGNSNASANDVMGNNESNAITFEE